MNIMVKYAIAIDDGYVSAHFGRCPSYIIISIVDGDIKFQKQYPNPGHERGMIPAFIHDKGVNYMICGGMGHRAQKFFQQYGITPILGVQGPIDEVITKIKNGNLQSGTSTCSPGGGKDYGVPRTDVDHNH